MCVHKTPDGTCKKLSGGGVSECCVEGPCPDDTPTNADRIRGMSDVELAEYITFHRYFGAPGHCLFWLRQPAEEVHDGH